MSKSKGIHKKKRTFIENASKSSKFDGTYENKSWRENL
jgi:hypothetical protein